MGGRKDGRKKVGTESSGSLSQSIYASGTATAEGVMGAASLAIGAGGARSTAVFTRSTESSTYAGYGSGSLYLS